MPDLYPPILKFIAQEEIDPNLLPKSLLYNCVRTAKSEIFNIKYF